jgi:hypothetical protein
LGLHAAGAIVGVLEAFCSLGCCCMSGVQAGEDCWGLLGLRGPQSMGRWHVPLRRRASR